LHYDAEKQHCCKLFTNVILKNIVFEVKNNILKIFYTGNPEPKLLTAYALPPKRTLTSSTSSKSSLQAENSAFFSDEGTDKNTAQYSPKHTIYPPFPSAITPRETSLLYVRSENSSRICVTVAASCVAVYQIYVLLYKKAGVEPPTYPQFRTLMKATLMDNVMGRGQYEDF